MLSPFVAHKSHACHIPAKLAQSALVAHRIAKPRKSARPLAPINLRRCERERDAILLLLSHPRHAADEVLMGCHICASSRTQLSIFAHQPAVDQPVRETEPSFAKLKLHAIWVSLKLRLNLRQPGAFFGSKELRWIDCGLPRPYAPCAHILPGTHIDTSMPLRFTRIASTCRCE